MNFSRKRRDYDYHMLHMMTNLQRQIRAVEKEMKKRQSKINWHSQFIFVFSWYCVWFFGGGRSVLGFFLLLVLFCKNCFVLFCFFFVFFGLVLSWFFVLFCFVLIFVVLVFFGVFFTSLFFIYSKAYCILKIFPTVTKRVKYYWKKTFNSFDNP